MPADKAVIGARLRAEREARIGSRAKMARRLRDMSDEPLPAIESLASMIKDWERGKHGPGEDYQQRYADAFGIPRSVLFGDGERALIVPTIAAGHDDEIEALELARRAAASDVGRVRARRVASARLDLSLALVASGRPDEAAHETLTAVTSGVLVPSNYWRAGEVIGAVEAARVPEVAELREAYRELCGPADE